MLPITIVPLLLQPDFGQTMLITMVWCTLFFVAGLHLFWVAVLGVVGLAGVFAAYTFFHHVRERIERFLDKDSGDSFQVFWSQQSFRSGGWFGTGPGEGIAKRHLPDAHTDFIFSVTGEEFGVVVCLCLVALFAFIVLRGLKLARRTDDTFSRLAITGLDHAVRPPGLHQHGGEHPAHARQGHDPAVRLLRRLVADLAGAGHRLSSWR